jgi:hypothetical protein
MPNFVEESLQTAHQWAQRSGVTLKQQPDNNGVTVHQAMQALQAAGSRCR